MAMSRAEHALPACIAEGAERPDVQDFAWLILLATSAKINLGRFQPYVNKTKRKQILTFQSGLT